MILDYFQEKPTWQKFFKKSKIFFWDHSGPFLPKFGQKWIFLEKMTQSVFQYSNYLPPCQEPVMPNEPFLRKLLDGYNKNEFVLFISLWDTANFRVLQLIEKSHNLIGQEHSGPYLRNQNFLKYEICFSLQQLQ